MRAVKPFMSSGPVCAYQMNKSVKEWQIFSLFVCDFFIFRGNSHLSYTNIIDPDQSPLVAVSSLELQCAPTQ